MTGFEPATSGSTIRRSNQLSYTHHRRGKRYQVLTGGSVILDKVKRRAATVSMTFSPSRIEGRLHLRKNCRGGRGGIRGGPDRAADHK